MLPISRAFLHSTAPRQVRHTIPALFRSHTTPICVASIARSMASSGSGDGAPRVSLIPPVGENVGSRQPDPEIGAPGSAAGVGSSGVLSAPGQPGNPLLRRMQHIVTDLPATPSGGTGSTESPVVPSGMIRGAESPSAAQEEEELIRQVLEAATISERDLRIPADTEWIGAGKQKYALLLCEDDPMFKEDVPAVWLKLLKERSDKEEWHVYRTAEKGELPTVDDDYHGVIIPGSSHSCYEDLEWIHRLKDYIRACFIPLKADHHSIEHSKKPQIVGSCFGCQLIAETLGGYVTKNPRGRYIVQAQEIFIQESFARQPFAEGLILKTKRGARFQPSARKWSKHDDTGSQPYMRITETHGDSVLTLPADAQVLGTSTSITNEIFLVGKNMLCYQGHPEFTVKSKLMKRVMPYVFPEDLPADQLAAAKRSFKKPLHSYGLIEVTRRFLKRRYRDSYEMYHSGSNPIAPPVVAREDNGVAESGVYRSISDLSDTGSEGEGDRVRDRGEPVVIGTEIVFQRPGFKSGKDSGAGSGGATITSPASHLMDAKIGKELASRSQAPAAVTGAGSAGK